MKPQILYIENDTNNVKSFKNQMANQNYFDYSIVNDLNYFDKNSHPSIIICNANYNNRNFKDVVHFFYPQKIIIVNETEISTNDNYYFFKSPFQINQLLKSIYCLNFSKINEIALDDITFKTELIHLVFSKLEINFKKLALNIKINNIKEVAFIAHKTKTIINLLQLPCIADFEYLEKNTNTLDNIKLKYSFLNIGMYVHIALYQFKIQ